MPTLVSNVTTLAVVLTSAAASTGPLTANPGDPSSGRAVFLDPERGHCQLCHQVSQLDVAFQGNLGPDLSDVGTRLSAAQLRARIVDPTQQNPETAMPAYYRWQNLTQVQAGYRNQPILAAQEVEDLVAFLNTLKGSVAQSRATGSDE